jgi:hypothetical protein
LVGIGGEEEKKHENIITQINKPGTKSQTDDMTAMLVHVTAVLCANGAHLNVGLDINHHCSSIANSTRSLSQALAQMVFHWPIQTTAYMAPPSPLAQ